MTTEIRTWQIADGMLVPVNASLEQEKRTEPYDLEPWIESNPSIVASDIAIIGHQVSSKAGPIDLLAVDREGNLVVIELKRDKLPRDVLAQAVDYASSVAEWGIEEINEASLNYSGKNLVDLFADAFPDVDVENLKMNNTQRILLVGFSVGASLERMVEWLSDGFGVNINAIVLSYIKTTGGEELLARTSIISEELEKERVQRAKKFQIPMSDEPGNYDRATLRERLRQYLVRPGVTIQRIRDILLPTLLGSEVVTREQLKEELARKSGVGLAKAGYYLTPMSSQLGMEKNDFLRQIISYEYPTFEWEKDNFSLRPDYRDFVQELLTELQQA
jgi:hypothetical protein